MFVQPRHRDMKPSTARALMAKNTLWVALGQTLRVGVQAVYLVLIARTLGSREYGAYVGALAVVAIPAPFASLGSGNLLIKHVARSPQSFPSYWGKALLTTFLTGTLLLALVSIVARVWLPASIPIELVVAVGGADLLFVRLVDISTQAYQAHHRLSRTALLWLLLSSLRLLAGIFLIAITPEPTVLAWGFAYLLSSVLAAGAAVMLVTRELGKPQFLLKLLTSELREGSYFSASLSAQSSTNDIDKAMLARMATLEATGVYAAAYRLIDVTFLPVRSLLVATYARFFQHGVQGVAATSRFARRLLTVGISYGLVMALALYLLAPALTTILGSEYEHSVEAVRWLAILPVLKAVHYFGSNALTGAGYQGFRTLVQVSVTALNVLLNIWLIPLYSWRGSAVASLLSDGLLAVLIWSVIGFLRRGAPPHSSIENQLNPETRP